MRSVFSLLVAAAAIAAAQAAPYQCKATSLSSTVSVSQLGNDWNCIELSNLPASKNSSVTFDIQADAWTGTQVQFIVHNPESSTASNQYQNIGASQLKLLPPGFEDWQQSAASEFGSVKRAVNQHDDLVFYSASKQLVNPCTGKYKVFVDLTNQATEIGKLHVLYRAVGRADPNVPTSSFPALPGTGTTFTAANSLRSGSSVVVTDYLLPSDRVMVMIDEAFAKEKFMIASAEVSLSTDRANLILNNSNWNLAIEGGFGMSGGDTPTKTFNDPVTKVALSYDYLDYTTAVSEQASVTFTLPGLSTDKDHKFSWTSATGAFITDLTVAGTFTEYPTLLRADGSTTAMSATLDTRPETDTDAQVDSKIYMVQVPTLWWNMTVVPTMVEDAMTTNRILHAANELVLTSLLAGRTVVQTKDGITTGFDDDLSTYNGAFYSWSGDRTTSMAKPGTKLSPVTRKYDLRYFVKVAINPARCLSNYVKYTIKGEAKTVVGECSSYASCVVHKESDHPAHARRGDSANNDARRFTMCGVTNGGSDRAIVPTTQCYECEKDTDCGEGQYCQKNYDGICDSNGKYWCDASLRTTQGLCQAKSKDVLGKNCRTDSFDAFSTSTTELSDVTEAGDVHSFAPGYGFCGEAVYYNSTAVDATYYNGYEYNVNGGGYKKLWSGKCFNGVCQECLDGQPLPAGNEGRTCVQGRIVDEITVDGTIRTFTQNAVAGTTLGTAMMVVLLIFCFAMAMLNDANRNREFYGQDPMGCCEVIWAFVCFMPCCHTRSSRADMAAQKWNGSQHGADVPNPLNGATA